MSAAPLEITAEMLNDRAIGDLRVSLARGRKHVEIATMPDTQEARLWLGELADLIGRQPQLDLYAPVPVVLQSGGERVRLPVPERGDDDDR